MRQLWDRTSVISARNRKKSMTDYTIETDVFAFWWIVNQSEFEHRGVTCFALSNGIGA
jgi:hypothetical protein